MGRGRQPRRRGFTLIELMITLSVVTILMLVALPSFIDKTVRDRAVLLAWLCGQAPAPDKMIALGQDRTTVPLGMLPVRCR